MQNEEKNLHYHYAVIERLFWIGFIIMVIPVFFTSDLWTGIFLFVGFGVMVAAVIYRNKFFKCPHCDSRLNVRGVPKHCPECGEPLF